MMAFSPRWIALLTLTCVACGPGSKQPTTTPAAQQPANDEVPASDDEGYLGTPGADSDDEGSDETMSDDEDQGGDEDDYGTGDEDEDYDEDYDEGDDDSEYDGDDE